MVRLYQEEGSQSAPTCGFVDVPPVFIEEAFHALQIVSEDEVGPTYEDQYQA